MPISISRPNSLDGPENGAVIPSTISPEALAGASAAAPLSPRPKKPVNQRTPSAPAKPPRTMAAHTNHGWRPFGLTATPAIGATAVAGVLAGGGLGSTGFAGTPPL